jgi:type IV secretion system protein VirB6
MPGFLSQLESNINTEITTAIGTAGATAVPLMQGLFVGGFTVWVMFIAYGIAFGTSEDGLTLAFTKIFKIFAIGVLALFGWPQVQEIVSIVHDGIILGFAGAPTISTILETNLLSPLFIAFQNVWDWPATANTGLGFTNLDRIFTNFLIWCVLLLVFAVMAAVVTVLSVVAGAMFMVSNGIFLVLIAIGPVFLLFLAFPFTQKFFETYIGSVMTSILATALTGMMVKVAGNVLNLTSIGVGATAFLPTSNIADIRNVILDYGSKGGSALLLVYLFYKVFDLAAALGGGLNVGNNMMGAMRTLARDAASSLSGGGGGKSNQANTIGQGNTGGANGGGGGGSGGRSSFGEAIARNRSLTGMAITAAAYGTRGAASNLAGFASGAASMAGRAMGVNSSGDAMQKIGFGAGRAVRAMGQASAARGSLATSIGGAGGRNYTRRHQ